MLVTGASRGVGRAVASAFAAAGNRVAVHHRDSADLAAATLAELAGDGHVVVRGDIADPAAVRALVEQAAAGLGGANVTFCALPHLRRAAGGGRVVNVSSRGAFRGEPDGPAYGATKAAVNSFGQSMAVALARDGIAVSTVAPGFIETDMTNEMLKAERGAEIRAQSPFDRVARADEVAAAVLYLASAEAEWASGAVLDLNGASYLRT